MPDTNNNRELQTSARQAPGDWNEAFAALPMESPGNDGWQRLTRALDATLAGSTQRSTQHPKAGAASHRRARWPLLLASAAAVSALALLPLLHRGQAPVQDDPARVANTAAQVVSPSPSPPAAAATPAPNEHTPPASTSGSAPAAVVASTAPADRVVARRKPVGTPTRKPAPAPVASPLRARGDNGTRVADAAPATGLPKQASASAATTTDSSAAALADRALAIQSLQAESAQLEAIVALARDERVSSASGAAVGVELDARIGRIDASLSQPGLADGDRAELWRQRVAAMRELAGIETTQRWLVTHGERYDGALVNVD